MNIKSLYFTGRVALAALFAFYFMLAPGAAAAQQSAGEVATNEMLSYALNFKSIGDVAVYGAGGVSGKGNAILSNGFRAAGAEKDRAERKDLADAFSAVNQLPCRETADTNLSGKTFEPGVYCLASAELASRLILDGKNNPGAVFVFRITGALEVKSEASIGLINDAQAANVFFVSNASATVGDAVDFKGNIIARDNIGIGADATIDGRVLSVKGEVATGDNSVLGPQQTGFLEICVAVDSSLGGDLSNRIFSFQIGAVTAEVLAGQCSGPVTVPTGPTVITQYQSGRTIINGVPGNNFNGNFQLTDVRLLNIGPAASVLTGFNLPNFTAQVNVNESGIENMSRIQFTNRFAVTAVVEICKEALDSGVAGFFSFTIDGITQGNSTINSSTGVVTPAPLVTFVAPTGQCTGFINVVVASDVSSGPPRRGTAKINELPRAGFIFTSATTAFGTATAPNRLVNFNALANGGGNATVTVVEGSPQFGTTVFFNNRTAPGQVKICKVAGPGIAELTPFSFTVTGTQPLPFVTTSTPVAVDNNLTLNGLPSTSNPSQGTLAAGAVPQGGTVVSQNIMVLAVSLSSGGFCQVASGLFVVGSAVTITENATGAVAIVNANGSSTGVTGEARISRITSSTGISSVSSTGTGTFTNLTRNANAPFFPPNSGAASTGANARAVRVPMERGITEIEFVNVAFSPVPLKICKIAGAGVPVGTVFNFTVTTDTAGGLLAPFSSTIAILAGPRGVNPGDPNGFCDFAAGPFTNSLTNGLGSFNFNSKVTVTEAPSAGFTATSITSPTGGVIVNLSTRTAVIPNLVSGINELQFTNSAQLSDETPPVITPTVTGTQGNNGFYTSNVTVGWNVSDPESSITSSTGCGSTTISADTAGTTLTCQAVSGGGSANQSITVKRDATPPTLIFAAPTTTPNAAGWYNANVSIPYTASDNISGVSASTPSGTLITSNEGNATTGNVTIIDNAGNSRTFTTTAVKIDKTPPVFAGISGSTVDLNGITTDPSVVTATINYQVSTTDNLDSAPLVNCSPIAGSIFQLGATNVNCGATDAAGNTATKTFQVNVLKTVTPAGTNVSVAPAPNLNLNFSNVSGAAPGTQAGVTVATPLTQNQAQPLPANFSVIGSPILYDITTTAAFSGDITVTFDVPNIASAFACSQLRVLHFTNGNWDIANNAAPVYNAAARTCTVSQTVRSLSPFTVAATLGTTAATVSVGGRVMTPEGRGIGSASVTMTGADGKVRTATTDEIGYYQFAEVEVGGTYIFSVRAKSYGFNQTAQVMSVNDEITNINFIGTGGKRTKNR